jgi:glycerol-3-phosphate dehydrogenase
METESHTKASTLMVCLKGMANTSGVMEVAIRETLSRVKEMATVSGSQINNECNHTKATSVTIRRQVTECTNGTTAGCTEAISKATCETVTDNSTTQTKRCHSKVYGKTASS